MNLLKRSACLFSLSLGVSILASGADSYQYFRLGNKNELHTQSEFGIAMMGGGKDLDEAFKWLCKKANGGDFLVLRAAGDDDYNSYIQGICNVNSVATLIIPDRKAAEDPAVAKIIRRADTVFIAGGDQGNYIRAWKGTPVEEAINANIAAGKPIGGTSAGLAVLGEFVYGALGDKTDDDGLASAQVLANPYFERVTLVRDFLKLPLLDNLLTDSHFTKRDRMGRTLGFLARLMQDSWSDSPREIAIDEGSALLVEPDGTGKVVGNGKGVYFLRPTEKPTKCVQGQPVTFAKVKVIKESSGESFDIKSWTARGGKEYFLSVENGRIISTLPNLQSY